jgi:hypothetical protein
LIAPVAAVDVPDVEDALVADDADEDLELELPHALTTAAIRNRQAAIAASLRVRMRGSSFGSPRLVQRTRRRSLWPMCRWTLEAAPPRW